jgi:hypothetical protein
MAQHQTQGIVTGRTEARGIVGLTAKRIGVTIDLNRCQIQDLGGPKAQRPVFPKMHISPDPPMQKPNLVLQAQRRRALAQLRGGVKTDAMRMFCAGETILARKFQKGTVALRHVITNLQKCNS